MGAERLRDDAAARTPHDWYRRIPVELHGHRKKVDFFLRSIERFQRERRLNAADVAILEIGCSNGRNVSLPLAERGYRVTGVDLHEPSIAWASANNPFPNARFLCQDAENFVTQETFDVVILSDILEHVTEPLKLLQLARRLVRESGLLLICIPNGYGPAELERRFIEATGLDRVPKALRAMLHRMSGRRPVAYNEDSGHIQYFRLRTIQSLIAQAGFVIDECQKGALLGGGFTYPLGRLSPGLVNASLRLANHLPHAVVSTWYFRCSVSG